MRVENLTKHQIEMALCKLHELFNKQLFNGVLNETYCVPPKEEWDGDSWRPPAMNMVQVYIGRAGNKMDFSALASFHSPIEEIIFDITFLNVLIPDYEDDEQQIEAIATTMLHEMIHQYIYEMELTDNSPHGRTFKRCCKEHGLKRYAILNDDHIWEPVDELMPEAKQVIAGFQWQ